MNETQYRRVNISGTLRLQSDLRLGSGSSATTQRRDAKTGLMINDEYSTVVLDSENAPYIPGSSLRGLLASLEEDETRKKRWFGDPRGYEADHGEMGALRVYDATLANGSERYLMSRTSIEAVTGTAKQHHLATHELVRAGTEFRIEISLDTKPAGDAELVSDTEVHALVLTLRNLTGAQLGGGKSVGQGELEWVKSDETVTGLSNKDFLSWLQNNLKQGKAKKGKQAQLNKYKHPTFRVLEIAPHPSSDSKTWHTVSFRLKPLAPILINNPWDTDVQKKLSPSITKEEKKKLPDMVFLNKGSQKRAIIPGSSIKGWFRAHCRRILLTLAQDDTGAIGSPTETNVDNALDELFGSTETGQSLMRFYDASLHYADSDILTQTFNAVDRFTGGVKDSALYKVRAFRSATKTFSGHIAYRYKTLNQAQNGWMNLLLLFAWRDAEEGDLVLGWGKSRGYGQLLLQPDDNGWQSWLDKLETGNLVEWERQLQQKLGVSARAAE